MKKRLRKRKKIRGGRAAFRCIADPTDGVAYWQGPDGVFRPLMRTCRVYFEVEEAVKRTLAANLDAIREHAQNPIQPQGLIATVEFDDDDPRGEQIREMLAAFQRKALRALRERLPEEIYKTLPEWAKIEEEPTP